MKKVLLLALFATSTVFAQEQPDLKSDSEIESMIYDLYLMEKEKSSNSININSYKLNSIMKKREYELSHNEANALLGKAKVRYTIINSYTDYLNFSSVENGTVLGSSSYVGFDVIGNPLVCKNATSGFKDYTYLCASVTSSIDYKGSVVFNWYLFNLNRSTIKGKFYISSDPVEATYAFVLDQAYDMYGTFYPKSNSITYNDTYTVTTTNTTSSATTNESISTPPEPPTSVDNSNMIDTIKNNVLNNNNGKYDITGYFAPYTFGNDAKSNWTFTFANTGETYQLLGGNISDTNIFGWIKRDVIPNNPMFYMVKYEDTPFGWLVFDIDNNGNCKNIYKLAGQDSSTKNFSYDIDNDGKVDILSGISCKVSGNSVEFYSNTLPGM